MYTAFYLVGPTPFHHTIFNNETVNGRDLIHRITLYHSDQIKYCIRSYKHIAHTSV